MLATHLARATLSALSLASLTALSAAAPVPAGTPGYEARVYDEFAAQAMQDDNFYRVWAPNARAARGAAISLEDALMRTDKVGGFMVMQLQTQDVARLKASGFRVERDEAYIAENRARLQRLRAAGMPNLLGEGAPPESADPESISGYPCYETVEETYAAAEEFVTKYPDMATWVTVGQSWLAANGQPGYDMKVLKLTNRKVQAPAGKQKPILFMTAAIHAREYATAPLALAFARQLLKGYGRNADATWLLDHQEVHFMFHHNPDGRKVAERGVFKRKNENQNHCPQISSLVGVDLNRNHSFGWNSTGGAGSSGVACTDTYRGTDAASEPESQAMEAYARSIWPDSRGPNVGDPAPVNTSGIYLDIHSYSQLVLWPWGNRNTVAPNGVAMQTLGRKLANFNGYMPEQSTGLYLTDGTTIDFAYGELGVAAYTFELGTQFFQSCSTYESTIKPDNLAALRYMARVARLPYQQPAGPDVAHLKLGQNAATSGVAAGTQVPLRATLDDTRYSGRNGTEPTQDVAAAEYFVDTPPWMPGAVAKPLAASDGAFDAGVEGVSGTIATAGLAKGKHMVWVRGSDAAGHTGPVWATFLVIK